MVKEQEEEGRRREEARGLEEVRWLEMRSEKKGSGDGVKEGGGMRAEQR